MQTTENAEPSEDMPPDTILDTITDTIFIDGLEFYAFHGVPDAEQEIGHRYRVDVRLSVDTRRAGATDDVADTVNYAEAARAIIEAGTGSQFRLLERLAEHIASVLMTRFVQVQAVNLRVSKPLPPMNAIVGGVGVEIMRHRGVSGA